MPRMSREETRETRARIVEVAARLFREKGIAATGVADLMKAAGLTHGGFYRHFASKDALAAEAISHAVCQSLEELESAEGKEAGSQALARYIDRYLSVDHVENPGRGCPLAALGTEAPRASAEVALQLGEGSDRAISALAMAMDSGREQAAGLMATMVGTVILARMSATQQQRDQILSFGKATALGFADIDIA